jgi:hypothetical protein
MMLGFPESGPSNNLATLSKRLGVDWNSQAKPIGGNGVKQTVASLISLKK